MTGNTTVIPEFRKADRSPNFDLLSVYTGRRSELGAELFAKQCRE